MREYTEDFVIENGILTDYRGEGVFGMRKTYRHHTPRQCRVIGEDAFAGCNLSIHAHRGTYAEVYAWKNIISFVPVD